MWISLTEILFCYCLCWRLSNNRRGPYRRSATEYCKWISARTKWVNEETSTSDKIVIALIKGIRKHETDWYKGNRKEECVRYLWVIICNRTIFGLRILIADYRQGCKETSKGLMPNLRGRIARCGSQYFINIDNYKI